MGNSVLLALNKIQEMVKNIVYLNPGPAGIPHQVVIPTSVETLSEIFEIFSEFLD